MGFEQSSTRSVLFVDAFHRTQTDLVVVLPITSKFKGFSAHVEFEPCEGGVTQTSLIMREQIRTISHERPGSRWRQVEFKTLQGASRLVKAILGF